MTRIGQQGFGARTIQRAYNGLDTGDGNGTPVLSEFYFMFTGAGVDHHLNTIALYPDGPIQDTAPNADPNWNPTNPDNGNLRLTYQDKEGNDEYFYNIGHELVSGVTRFRMRDVGCRGGCTRPINRPDADSAFAIVGFQFSYFSTTDHHVDEIAIQEREGVLEVAYNDKNDDDTFSYVVDYVWLNGQRLLSSGSRNGTARGGARSPLPSGGTRLVGGFRLNFTSQDHHIRDVGVRLVGSDIEVYYGDKNFDDQFSWTVDYVTLRPRIVIGDFIDLRDGQLVARA